MNHTVKWFPFKDRDKQSDTEKVVNEIFTEYPDLKKFMRTKQIYLNLLISFGITVHLMWYIFSAALPKSVFSHEILPWICSSVIFFYLFLLSQKRNKMPGVFLILMLLCFVLELYAYLLSYITGPTDNPISIAFGIVHIILYTGSQYISSGGILVFFRMLPAYLAQIINYLGTGVFLSSMLMLLFYLLSLIAAAILCLPKHRRMMNQFYELFLTKYQLISRQQEKLQQSAQTLREIYEKYPDMKKFIEKRHLYLKCIMRIECIVYIIWIYLAGAAQMNTFIFSMLFFLLSACSLYEYCYNASKNPFSLLFMTIWFFAFSLLPTSASIVGDTPLRIVLSLIFPSWNMISTTVTTSVIAGSILMTLFYLLILAAAIMLALPKNRRMMNRLNDLLKV